MKLEVKNIKKSFAGTEVLHGVSFSVTNGKALGLLGRNGAGKTTTIRILMDVFRANSGEILLDGKPFKPMKHQIGYLPEEGGLYPKKKVLEQIVYLAQLRGISKKEAISSGKKWLEKLEISEYENRVLESLSKGNQQKVQLAQTLVCNPEIVILDEPFSGLDPVNSQILKDTIVDLIKEDKVVIFSSHQMNYVEEFCEEIAIINKGNVVLSGNLKDIKREYGKNRLILSAVNYTLEELKMKLEKEFNNLLTVEEIKKEFIVINLENGKTKKEFINIVNNTDIDIEVVGDYQPTLNDIFIQEAGDDNNE